MALTQKQIDRLNKSMVAMQTPTAIGTMLGSWETALEGIVSLLSNVTAVPAVITDGVEIDATAKIVTITFENAVFTVLSDADLKAAVTFAADGTTYSALGETDTVVLNDFALVVTFASALTGATNKIQIAANTVLNTIGNGSPVAYITPAIVVA